MILFFSTVAVSLVILIIFFSLFFKDVDLKFNTRLPESAPDLGKFYGDEDDSKASGLNRSTINVPPEFRPMPDEPVSKPSEEKEEVATSSDEETDESVTEQSQERVDIDEQPSAPVPAPAPKEPKKEVKKEAPKKETLPAEEEKPAEPSTASYQVYMGDFASREDAEAAAARATAAGVSPLIKHSGGRYTVQLGSFSSKENADSLAGRTGARVRKN